MNKLVGNDYQLKSHEYEGQEKGIYLYTLVWILEEGGKKIVRKLSRSGGTQDCPMPS